jgi:hypothetical protein
MDAFDAQHADERATLLALHALGSFAAAGRACSATLRCCRAA